MDPDALRDPKDREVEVAFWESVRESDNPAAVRAYLEKYPAGEFKALAEIKLADSTGARVEAEGAACRAVTDHPGRKKHDPFLRQHEAAQRWR